MPAINFPDAPSVSQIHSEAGITWIWTGITWDVVPPIFTEAHEIKEGGTPLTQRSALNFDGDDFNLTDDVGNDETDIAISDAKWATRTYAESLVTSLLELKGDIDASTEPNYPVADKGDAYYITVAGKVGGASGKSVDIGDVVVAKADNAGGDEATVGTSWFVLEHNLVGALLAANNLSDLSNVATARVNLRVDKRTTVGNTNYSILITDKEIVTSVALTANREWTLPVGENAGQEFVISDEFQAIGTFYITIKVGSGKTLNGVTDGTLLLKTTGGHRRFFGDGNGNYSYDAGLARISADQTFSGINTFSGKTDLSKINLNGSPSVNESVNGFSTDTFLAGESITKFQLVYYKNDGRWWLTDADFEALSSGMLGVAMETKTAGQSIVVALAGSFIRNDSWNWGTLGGKLFVSATAGALTLTAPTGSNDVVRIVGYAVHADMIYFNPSGSYVVLA